MRIGAQRVLRVLAHRVIVLLLAAGAFLLAGDPRGAGLAAGLLVTLALIAHTVAFGVAATMTAAAAAWWRWCAAAGVLLAAGAGVWASQGEAFALSAATLGGLALSWGGALLHLAAFLVSAGACVFVFVCIAGRATALGDGG
ncbi:MAG: hypothetical protein NW200_11705 [Hyphomonadaceae bacterium]|nr:hypothetical protein [Hyphomonadaceae bacterium]